MTVIERRQDAIDAMLGVLNDIGGGQQDNFNVSYEAAGLAVDAVARALDYEGAVNPAVIVAWLRGRTGAHGGAFTSPDDVADAIEREFVQRAERPVMPYMRDGESAVNNPAHTKAEET